MPVSSGTLNSVSVERVFNRNSRHERQDRKSTRGRSNTKQVLFEVQTSQLKMSLGWAGRTGQLQVRDSVSRDNLGLGLGNMVQNPGRGSGVSQEFGSANSWAPKEPTTKILHSLGTFAHQPFTELFGETRGISCAESGR